VVGLSTPLDREAHYAHAPVPPRPDPPPPPSRPERAEDEPEAVLTEDDLHDALEAEERDDPEEWLTPKPRPDRLSV
jgi:hypothetical protein